MRWESQRVFVPRTVQGSVMVAQVRRPLLQLELHDSVTSVAPMIVFYAGEGVEQASVLSFSRPVASQELMLWADHLPLEPLSLATCLLPHGGPKARSKLEIIQSFDELNLREELLRGVYAYGFDKPSAV